MRKFTFLALFAVVFSGLFFNAKAQDSDLCLGLRGPFNDFDPGNNTEWLLQIDEDALEDDEYIFAGYFEIPEGQFTINFAYLMGTIIPGEYNDDGEIVASETNVEVPANEYYYGEAAVGKENIYWVCEDWAGGGVSITVSLTPGMEYVIFDPMNSEAPDIWYVRGVFNDFEPFGDPEWALVLDEDAFEEDGEWIYSGIITIPEGEFSLNLQNPYGMIYIPASIANEEIEFTDGEYTGETDYAFDDEEYTYTWSYPAWTGGQVMVKINLNESTVTFIEVPEEIIPDDIWYVRGEFNDFNPDSDVQWALLPVEGENGVYSGTFDIPEDEFAFNLLSPYGVVFIPSDLQNVVVEFDSQASFTGFIDMAYEEIEESFCWTYPLWGGANVEVKVDTNTSEIFINILGSTGVQKFSLDGTEVIYNINGQRVDRNKIDKGIYIVNGKKVIF